MRIMRMLQRYPDVKYRREKSRKKPPLKGGHNSLVRYFMDIETSPGVSFFIQFLSRVRYLCFEKLNYPRKKRHLALSLEAKIID